MAGQQETIAKIAQAQFVYKRVLANGAGEFALVQLRLEPLPRGAGIEFNNALHAATLPERLVQGFESGVRNAARFGLNGFPIVDFRAVLTDGTYHDLDSSPESFARAGAEAFRIALKEAGVITLF